MTPSPIELQAVFTRNQLRLTKPRQAVFEVLRTSTQPLSIGELIKRCPGIDRVSIYRTLDLFVKLAVATPVHVGWKQRYELTSPFRAHHHHLHCTSCGSLVDIHSEKLEELITAIINEHHFTLTEHRFEVSGLCGNCQK